MNKPLLRHTLLRVGLLGGSLLTAWLAYALGRSCLQDWVRLRGDWVAAPWPAGLWWVKVLLLAGWLGAALRFLRDRSDLTRDV